MPMQTTQFPASINVAALTSRMGVSLLGTFGDLTGFSVGGGGDINADGIDDLIIGSPGINSNAGVVYVVFGGSGLGSLGDIVLTSLNGSNGFNITGEASGDQAGFCVSITQDINADGVADLIIGAHWANSKAGTTYVIFGKNGIGGSGSMALSSLDGSNGFVLHGITAGDNLGFAVAGVGDINADGIQDMIVSAPGANNAAGISYVVFGKAGIGSSGSFALSSLNGSNGFTITGVTSTDLSGTSVSGAGDINTDGIDDLMIGAYNAAAQAGNCYVVFGKSGIGSGGTLALSSLNGSNGLKIFDTVSGDQLGTSASYAGDVNADGIADIIMGAPGTNNIKGASYVLFGKSGVGGTGSLAVSSISFFNSNGFSIPGLASGDATGQRVSGGFDINADGIQDIIIGAPDGTNGASYVIFGSSIIMDFGIGVFPLSGLTGGNGFTIIGELASGLGYWVNSAGDVNADGIQDIVIGAPTRTLDSNKGASYVLFGDAISYLTSNSLTITKGHTVLFTSSNMNATYGKYPLKDPKLLFSITDVQHGYFALVSSIYEPIYSFVQQQVRNGQVLFSHDDSGFPPSYSVQLSGGLAASLPQAATVSFIHQGAELINNQLSISQGQTVTLFATQLSAQNLDNPEDNPNVLFIVSNIQHGFFQQIGNPGIPVTSFIQMQVQTGTIQFVHDGSSSMPTYSVAVSDGSLITSPKACSINFNLGPILGNNTLTLNQGQTVLLTSSMLSAMDPDDSAASLIFLISNIQHGQFELVSSPGNAITSFTQAQIQNGDVQFVPDGSPFAPIYQVAISDGKMTIPSVMSQIIFNAAPVLVNNALIINQGQTVILTSDILSAIDPDDSSSALIFIISNIQGGHFEFVSSPGTEITSFSQDQVQNGLVQFVQDGSVTPPEYSVFVSDGKMTIPAQNGAITFNAKPQINVNRLTITQGQTLIFSSNELSASDRETASEDLVFSASGVSHGHFEDIATSGVAINRFAQQRISSGSIKFITDGSIYAPFYNMSVSDGRLSTTSSPALINFSLKESITSGSSDNTIRNAIIGGTVSGGIGLGFFALKLYLGYKADQSKKLQANVSTSDTERNVLRITIEIFKRIKTSNFIGYRSDDDTQAYIDVVRTIVNKLARQKLINPEYISEADLIEIAKQTRSVLGKLSYCSCAYVGSFFRREMTPKQFQDKAGDIVKAVAGAFAARSQTYASNRRLPLKGEDIDDIELQETKISSADIGVDERVDKLERQIAHMKDELKKLLGQPGLRSEEGESTERLTSRSPQYSSDKA